MTPSEFGDVVLVPFPFTDQSDAKKRPAVVVSSAVYNRQRPDVILMAITSQVRQVTTAGEVIVQRWREAGLLKPGMVKPVLATFEKRLLLKKLGHLEEEDLQAVSSALRTILGA